MSLKKQTSRNEDISEEELDQIASFSQLWHRRKET